MKTNIKLHKSDLRGNTLRERQCDLGHLAESISPKPVIVPMYLTNESQTKLKLTGIQNLNAKNASAHSTKNRQESHKSHP